MAIGFFDGNKADASPDSIKRKREMIARMMASARSPRNIGEGFNAIGNNIAAAMLGRQSDDEERRVNASSAEAMRGIYSGFGSPTASAGNPVATGSATGSGATRAPQSFTGTQTEFVAKIMPYAVQEGERTGVDPRIIVAQAALESGYGRSAPGNNFFGIKSHGRPGGQTFATTEVINGQTKRINDSFRTFASMGDSVRGYGDFLKQNPRYRPMLEAQGMDAQIAALGRSGYATDPNYASKIRSIASGIRMPVINPGNGATPMPLARQQAQTAPMPNAGLADLPAPGANQSGMNVAPVQGDNAQQLLADADYYEQNGNPEAARQMRERAAMAGQSPAPDGAFQAPLDGSQPDPLRDMFSSRGVGFADNEAETQGFEARMAQDQAGVPMPDPSQVQTVAITPNAQNADDVFSPVPMGIGSNPFVPRNMAPPADVAAPGAETAAVSPRMVTAPMPPPRPSDLRPQSPFVPPAMRQPMSMDFGGENSGGAMQFIESEFARREGRPDPRTAMGAPGQIYNPFVQQPTQAPQMPAGGGSVQGVSQGDTVAGSPAQAPAQASNRIAYLASVAGNSMNNPEVRQLAMAEIQTERARAQAEAERARVQAQNEAAARAAGLDPALTGNTTILGAAAKSRFDRMAGNAKRSLQPVYGTDAQGNTVVLQLGDDGTVVQSQLPKDVKIATGVDKVDTGTEFVFMDKRTGAVVGRQPKDVAGAARQGVIGKDEGERIVNAPGEIRVADEALATINQIRNHPGREGWGAQGATAALPWIGNGIPGTAGRDFVALVDQAKGQAFLQAFESLKGGGQITNVEGEAATKARARLDRTQSREGFDQALNDIEAIANKARDRAMRGVRVTPDGREYPIGQQPPPSGQTNAPAQGSKVLRYNPKTGALE
jgi:flagellum-specific peptidoglycan hydrolase FlgJ